jgi:fructose-specific phosphotransferase system component IIB
MRLSAIAAATIAGLALTACSSFAHSYMSPAERQANGRQLLQEAVRQSDVVTIQSGGGGGAVVRIESADEEQYCSVLLATRGTLRHSDRWIHYDNDEPETVDCHSYHGIVRVQPTDMRNCQGTECVWLRGL